MSDAPTELDRVPTQAGYDRWAQIYDDYDNPLVALEEPLVRELLGEVSGLEIADIGCGTGRHTISLARRGARVTGLDFSSGMLEQARAKVGELSVRLIQHDLTEALPLASASFDRVISCLVLEHVVDLDGIFVELARICRPGGEVVISDLHPDMVRGGVGARFTDPATGRKQQMQSAHHPLDAYRSAAARAGLELETLREGTVDGALAARSESAKKYLGTTLLVAMRFVRRG